MANQNQQEETATNSLLVILGIIIALVIGYFLYQDNVLNDPANPSATIATNTTATDVDNMEPAAGSPASNAGGSSATTTNNNASGTTMDTTTDTDAGINTGTGTRTNTDMNSDTTTPQ